MRTNGAKIPLKLHENWEIIFSGTRNIWSIVLVYVPPKVDFIDKLDDKLWFLSGT